MIPAKANVAQAPGWRQQWREAVRDPLELLSLLELPPPPGISAVEAARRFSLRVPRHFIARMRPGDPDDPLLKQVLPLPAEDIDTPGFTLDAVGDLAAGATPGLIRKYHGRALVVSTGSCAIHCRYCFRRHFPYSDHTAASGAWGTVLEELRSDRSIDEVLLSGGDPLSLSTRKLAGFSTAVDAIPHVRRLRLHTRLPIVLPARVDAELTAWLRSVRKQLVVVVHANHPNEIDEDVVVALRALRSAGATVLNQSVLLRGVNDRVDTLAQLSERLFAAGTLPYYLHQLDRVAGVAHFEVDDDEARRLEQGLRATLPGYLVPRLVRETAGAASKLPL